MAHTAVLEPILDIKAASSLQSTLLAVRGEALEIDASAVQRLGGLCLQVLLAARHSWNADDVAFRVINPSEAFANAVQLFGAARLLGDLQSSAMEPA